MVLTRSATMDSISDEVKSYFENLIKPLLLKSDQIVELLSTIDAQQRDIASLKTAAIEQDSRITKLEAEIAVKDSAIIALQRSREAGDVAVDDLQQYTRRHSVRISGIEVKDGETNADVVAIVASCHREVGLEFDESSVNRAHRVGKPFTDASTGKKKQGIIVQFRSWGARCRLYQNRPKFKPSAPPGASQRAPARKFAVSLDLTKRRLDLLSSAREAIVNYPEVKYVYNDINCNLTVRLGDDNKHFNTVEQLERILAKCKYIAPTARNE